MLAISACTTCSIQMIETPLASHLADQRDQRLAFVLGQPARDFVEQAARAGSVASARASSSRLRSSSVRLPAGRLALSASPQRVENVHAAVIGVVLAPPGAERRRHDQILEHAHAGERQRDLERAADAGFTVLAHAALSLVPMPSAQRRSGDICVMSVPA